MKYSKFTLMELMIILTAALLFAALLIPAAGSAGGQSKNAACLDNMRKCQNAAAGYAADFDGIMFLKSSDVPMMTLLWSMVMGRSPVAETIRTKPRLTSFEEITCPALNAVVPTRKTPGVGRYASFYAVPYMSLGGLPAQFDTEYTVSKMYDLRNRNAFFNPSGNSRKAQIAINTKKLFDPSCATVFAEAYSKTEKKGFYFYNFNTGSTLLDLRHDAQTNMVFADGHAASLEAGHFMDLKDNGYILTRNRPGELYNSVTGETIKY